MKKMAIILGCLMAFGCGSSKSEDKNLVGKWEGSLKDSNTGNPIEDIVLEFSSDGDFLQYLGHGEMQTITESTYKINNDKIIAIDKQTKEEMEGAYVIKNDTLTIAFEGLENKYTRAK